MPFHNTTTNHDEPRHAVNWNSRALCQVCRQRDGQAYLDTLLVCGKCFEEAKDEAVSIWRMRNQLIREGWAR